eukprot:3272348-Pleurochrysis_carterae.AAC.3
MEGRAHTPDKAQDTQTRSRMHAHGSCAQGMPVSRRVPVANALLQRGRLARPHAACVQYADLWFGNGTIADDRSRQRRRAC